MTTTKQYTPIPIDIILHQQSRVLEISFDDGKVFRLPYEYLRVYTPSAEATGHGTHKRDFQPGNETVSILEIKPVGNYGIAPLFTDGHSTGIYTWVYLYQLGVEYLSLWDDYLSELEAAGHFRNSTLINK
jgi:DUF971 family protein